MSETEPEARPSKRFLRIAVAAPKNPKLAKPVPPPKLRLKLRSKLVVAMVFAALVPVVIVASLATGVILSSLEGGLRDDADRQLTVGLNLVLRSVERLSDETVQLAESTELIAALENPEGDVQLSAIEKWLAHEAVHIPSARLQLFDANGKRLFDRVIGGAVHRFRDAEVMPEDSIVTLGQSWTRTVALVAVNDRTIVRAVSPIVDGGLALKGVIVLSTPLDGDFADGIKGALSADVLIGGTSGLLQVTFRSRLGRRSEPVTIAASARTPALGGQRVVRDLDIEEEGGVVGQYKIAVTALEDSDNRPVGLIGVAVDRAPLAATKRLAIRSLVLGGSIAIAFALILALIWSRRLGAPIARLHRGAIAVSRGDLEHRIDIPGGDELTDLATAFNQMTSTLKDNQARLAARMREIVALHDAGRAVSSVIDLDSVSRKIVDAVARTFDIQLAALWLVEGGDRPQLRASAARARRADVSSALATDEALAAADALRSLAEEVQRTRQPIRLERAAADATYSESAKRAGAPGPLVALPLDRKARVVGVLAVGRAEDAREFSEADFNLLTTFADQAGAAVENALLYQEVREASEELEKKVRLRTAELTAINTELGKALANLRETQAQLILSERMAGLGLLVAGVAHEINSPTAAIRGSIDGLGAALMRVGRHGAELATRASVPAAGQAITDFLEKFAPQLAERPLPTGLTARKAARDLVTALEAGTRTGAPLADPHGLAAELADLGVTVAEVHQLIEALGPDRAQARAVIAALTDHVYLHRTSSTIRHAIGQIQRIVGALKSYSHLDQQATRVEADVHEGLETTLALLHHALRDIVVERRYGNLPRVAVYVDELNQVWTNLIQNAQQALAGKGAIAIETAVEIRDNSPWAVVRVIDDGPGVPTDALPQIFEPFFTTKPKGEGTGLGLGIARQIVDKHQGVLRCESEPGRTVFEVWLPILAASEVAS
ncbi:MAG: GAF domain-containing protein [Deltaproteobacteria bacterium]|nr:GAF domain-containing protein [Deltaproteobacteria bacterium]